jgi:hypothetical protein
VDNRRRRIVQRDQRIFQPPSRRQRPQDVPHIVIHDLDLRRIVGHCLAIDFSIGVERSR